MYLFYVDESGDPGMGGRGSRHLLLGGVALFEGCWSHLREEVESLLKKAFPGGTIPPEIHCKEVRRGAGAYSRLSRDDRDKLLHDFCALAGEMLPQEMRMFTVIYDKAWWAARNPGRSGKDLYLEAFENLASRADLFLRRRHAEGFPTKGLLILDPHSSDLCSSLKGALTTFQVLGNRWNRVYNLVESAMFLPSHESPGLQLADLCSYAVWRLVEYNDRSLARELAPCFDREPLASAISPGKWHGVKYFGDDPKVEANLTGIWP